MFSIINEYKKIRSTESLFAFSRPNPVIVINLNAAVMIEKALRLCYIACSSSIKIFLMRSSSSGSSLENCSGLIGSLNKNP